MQRLLVTIPMSARVYAHQFKYFSPNDSWWKTRRDTRAHQCQEKHEKHENQDIAQMRKHRKRDNGNDDNVDDEDVGADQSL